jgi:hypothetical protein
MYRSDPDVEYKEELASSGLSHVSLLLSDCKKRNKIVPEEWERIKTELIDIVNKNLDRECNRVVWKKSKDCTGHQYYGYHIYLNPEMRFGGEQRFIDETKKQLEDRKEKCKNKLLEILQNIDELHSSCKGKTKEQIETEKSCIYAEADALLWIYVKDFLKDDGIKKWRLEFLKLPKIF